jgi:hypothetical protein
MSERRDITVSVFSDRVDEEQSTLKELIKFLQAKLDSVPAEYRDSVMAELETDFESSYASIDIYYKRQETDEEMNERIAKRAAHEAQREAAARREYEILKKRFEG